MLSSLLEGIPPQYSEYQLSLNNQQVYLQMVAEHQQLPVSERFQTSKGPIIQNYYCFQKEGFLIKITLIRIGRSVLKLTDRISIKKQNNRDEDQRTRSSPGNSPLQIYHESQKKTRRNKLSKTGAKLLKIFELWIRDNQPQNIRYISQINEENSNESYLGSFLAYHPSLRQCFINFNAQFIKKVNQIRLQKLSKQWARQCIIAKQVQRQKEEYIEQVLQAN